MRELIVNTSAVLLLLGMSLNVLADGNSAGKRLILNLTGTGTGYASFVEDGKSGSYPATCFEVDLINAKNNQLIGSATDCLSNAEPVGTGLELVAATTFNLPSGTLTVRGETTVQPVIQTTVVPNGQPEGQNITHITGASGTGNAVISGTMRFANATGTSRLSGMVDLSQDGKIFFDCLFIIDLD